MTYKSKLSFFVILAILLLGAFLRLYHIREYMGFLGDEGRDMLVVKRMVVNHEWTLLGPITSIGRMYMGPIYFYMISPFLALWNFDPVGPSIMVALFSVATIYLIYKFCKEFFSELSGIIAAFFYAISPLTIIYGRASWNPNVVPFFSMLLIYGLAISFYRKKYNWLLVSGFCLGILVQLHYVTLILAGVSIICFIFLKPRPPLKYIALFFLFSVIGYSPFLLFEIRHQFVNTQNTLRFIFEQKRADSAPLYDNIFAVIADVSVRLFWRLLVIQSAEITKGIMALGSVLAVVVFYKRKISSDYKHAGRLVFLWLAVGLLGFGLYRGIIYDYYLGSLFPIPFILIGVLSAFIFKTYKLPLKIIIGLLLLVLVGFNIVNSPFKNDPNNLLATTANISKFVYHEIGNKPYNFALIATHNSDHAYRYFFDLWGNPPVVIQNPQIDPSRTSVQKELWIICEEKVCKPLGHPLWEIAGFGPAEIVGEWKMAHVTIFKLVHAS